MGVIHPLLQINAILSRESMVVTAGASSQLLAAPRELLHMAKTAASMPPTHCTLPFSRFTVAHFLGTAEGERSLTRPGHGPIWVLGMLWPGIFF